MRMLKTISNGISAVAMIIVTTLGSFPEANSNEQLNALPFSITAFNEFLNHDDDIPIDFDRECGPPKYSETTCVYSLTSEFVIAVNSFSKSVDMPAHSVVVYWNKPDPEMSGSEDAFRKNCRKLLRLLGEPSSDVFLPRLRDYKKSLEVLTERYNFFYEYARETMRCEIIVAG